MNKEAARTKTVATQKESQGDSLDGKYCACDSYIDGDVDPSCPEHGKRAGVSVKCHGCGMPTRSVREYHPFIACVLFEHTRNSLSVDANLRAVVNYGMTAEKKGVSLDGAMSDLTKVLTSTSVPHASKKSTASCNSKSIPSGQ